VHESSKGARHLKKALLTLKIQGRLLRSLAFKLGESLALRKSFFKNSLTICRSALRGLLKPAW
jgi:hypothetical protein